METKIITPSTRRIGRRAALGLGAAALSAGGTFTLTSCGGSSGGAPGKSTVTFVFYGDADRQKEYQALFNAFTQANPDIAIKAQGVPAATWADFLNTISTRLAGGQQIDTVLVATEGQRLFASKGLLEPLDDYLAKDQAFVDELYQDTPPQLITWLKEFASPDGKTYYMPLAYNTMAMYVALDVFKAAGLDLPDEEWTWDDFRQAGRTIKDKTGAFLMPSGSGYFVNVMPWLVTNGTSTMDPTWTQSTFGSPEAIEALTFVRSLIVDGLSPKPGGTFDAGTQLSRGKLACLGGGRWPTPDLQRLKVAERVQLYRWPKNKAAGAPVGWEGIPILKNSKNKDAAWSFIKFLMSEPFGDAFTKSQSTSVPARISDATGKDFLAKAPKNSELLYEQLEFATPVPSPERATECQKVIEEAWLQGITGNKTPEAALGEAHAKLQELLQPR
ncbi:ABC transporter substrate-binding protein [Microlunatus parietis]|uniref:ABC-type glycerol-3-phosphate transport system substrate-binding protein n=1 Tax=Microlunatus parietis TaxID=682979 RepID=A0A7Y9LDL2_9ACTN|nr:sugar ABC transporter substrate-binding protein [Microlunatus parietis]NYE72988.1 ABC-type glycerol-3-phosphate transport system substrate-binding protein [Microlunatus parietis]